MFDRLAGRAPRRTRRCGRRPRRGDLAPAHERLRDRDRPAGRRRPPARRPLTMRARRVADADAFLALVGPLLRAREAEHNLALGLLGRLRVEPRLYGFDPTFVVVEDAGEIVGCLLRTPPHGVVLSRFEDLAGSGCRRRRGDRHASGASRRRRPGERRQPGSPSVVALAPGAPARLACGERVHAAAAVRPVPRAPGHMRNPRPDDVPTVVAWLRAFADEALAERHTSRMSSSPTAAGRPTPTAPGSSGTTAARSRSPHTATRRRTASGSAPSTRRRSTEGAGTRRRSCRPHRRAARHGPRVLLPLHRPREPDLERDLRPDRLRAGRRLGSVVVPAA